LIEYSSCAFIDVLRTVAIHHILTLTTIPDFEQPAVEVHNLSLSYDK